MSRSRSLSNRVVLLTGVSREIGIGASLARRLLDDGASVFATGWASHDDEMTWGADADRGEALLAELEPGDGRLHYREADLEDPEVADALVRETVERFGSIDILIANHARSSIASLADVTALELDRCWAANGRASILLAQSFAAHHDPARPHGRMLLFCSGQHIGPMSNEIAYAVTKGAIHQMTASLSDALIDQGITVNCINPGPTDTGYAPPKMHQAVAAKMPAGRWGMPEDVANLVAWLVSDEAAWITGQVINSEGGFRRWK
ncbi:MAG: SDR family oxidoreductase [bacterium]|nr:SDR family oxidoreductase [bacterium]MCP5067195.1 SDR family oxidoreductase [bacterium]